MHAHPPTAKIQQAESDPKLKMSLVFRWYLGLSSTWANTGVVDRCVSSLISNLISGTGALVIFNGGGVNGLCSS